MQQEINDRGKDEEKNENKLYDMEDQQERFILVGVSLSDDDAIDSLEELNELVDTAGGSTVGRIIQNREKIHPTTYIGKGKIEEVRRMISETDATGVICDDELTPVQLKILKMPFRRWFLTGPFLLWIFLPRGQQPGRQAPGRDGTA